MSETIDKPKNLIPILTQKLTEILDETKKPMNIVDIKEKYNLSFPFQVKNIVCDNGFPQITTITEIKEKILDDGLTKVTNNMFEENNEEFYQGAVKFKYYVLHEEN